MWLRIFIVASLLAALAAATAADPLIGVDGKLDDWPRAGATWWSDPSGDILQPARDVISAGLFRDSDSLHFVFRMAGQVGTMSLSLTCGLALDGAATVGSPVGGLSNANRRVIFSTANGVSIDHWNAQTSAWETLQSAVPCINAVNGDSVTFSVTLDAMKSSASHDLLFSTQTNGGDRAPNSGGYAYTPTAGPVHVWNKSFAIAAHPWIPTAADIVRVWFAEDTTNLYFRLDFGGPFSDLDAMGLGSLPEAYIQMIVPGRQDIGIKWGRNYPNGAGLWRGPTCIVSQDQPTAYIRPDAGSRGIEGYFPLSMLNWTYAVPFDFSFYCWGVDRHIPTEGTVSNGWTIDLARDWSITMAEDWDGFNVERANTYYWEEMPVETRTDIDIANSEGHAKNLNLATRFVDARGNQVGATSQPVTIPANGSIKAPIRWTPTVRGYIAAYYSLTDGAQQVVPEQRTTFAVIPQPDMRQSTADASVLGANIYWNDYIVNQGAFPGGAEIARRYGFKQVRYQIPWRSMNPSAGAYNWSYESTGQMPLHPSLDAMRAAGLKVIGKIWGSPPWQTGAGMSWCNPPNQDSAYSAFVGALFGETGSQINEWFAWNEQDACIGVDPITGMPNGWTPQRFVSFLANARSSIKALHPTDSVMCNFSNNNLDWMEEAYNAGAMPYIDAQGIHSCIGTLAYGADFDAVATYFYRLRRMMAQFGGEDKPIFLDETGWGGGTEDDTGRLARATDMAKVLSRVIASKWGLNLYRISLHQLGACTGCSAYFSDDHNRPKPLCCALAVAAHFLDGGSYAGTFYLGTNVESHIIVKDDQPVLVLWAKQGTQSVSLPVAGATATMADMMGNESTVQASGGALSITLDQSPVYIRGWQSPVWIETDATIFPFKFAALTQPATPVMANASVHNGSGQAQSGVLSLGGESALSITPSTRAFSVQPGASQTVQFGITLNSGATAGTYTLTASVPGRTDILEVRSPFRVMEDIPLLHPIEANGSSFVDGSYPSLVVDGKADTEWKPDNPVGPHTLDIMFDPAQMAREVIVVPDVAAMSGAVLNVAVDLWQNGSWQAAGSGTMGSSEFSAIAFASSPVAVSGLRLRFNAAGAGGSNLPVIKEVYLTSTTATKPVASSSAVKVSSVLDADPLTPWIAAGTPPQWLMLDLGAIRAVRTMTLSFDSEASLRPTALKIQSYDEATGTWRDQYTYSDAMPATLVCAMPGQVLARRVRAVVTSVPSGVGVRVGDISVSADPVGNCLLGMTFDSQTRAPIAGAIVRLDSGQSATSADDGSFFVGGISSGSHQATAQDANHQPCSVQVTIKADEPAVAAFPMQATQAFANVVYDTFTRPNSSDLGSTEDAQHIAWVKGTGETGASITDGGLYLSGWVNNKGASVGGGFLPADIDLMTAVSWGGGANGVGVTYRQSSPGTPYAGGYYVYATMDAREIRLFRSGIIASVVFADPIDWSTPHWLRVKATGSHHEAWLDGNRVIDVIDSGTLGAGYVGCVRCYGWARFDNVSVAANGALATNCVQSVLDLKALRDGVIVDLADAVVTGAFSGFFYISDTDRIGGVRVVSPRDVVAGNHVRVIGVLTTSEGERRINALSVSP